MNKKYSVFVSSTYEDLKEERQEVVNALLKMDCFPVGMEYFNASDKSQWEVIKNLIEECDYYILNHSRTIWVSRTCIWEKLYSNGIRVCQVNRCTYYIFYT